MWYFSKKNKHVREYLCEYGKSKMNEWNSPGTHNLSPTQNVIILSFTVILFVLNS